MRCGCQIELKMSSDIGSKPVLTEYEIEVSICIYKLRIKNIYTENFIKVLPIFRTRIEKINHTKYPTILGFKKIGPKIITAITFSPSK